MEKKVELHMKDLPPVETDAQGLNGMNALQALGIANLEKVAAVKINGELKDISAEIDSSAEIEPVYIDSQEGLHILRHSAAHVMAEAVKDLFPGVKVTIGPAIQDGFYYDFDYERPFDSNDLPKIESKMAEIVSKDLPFIRSEVRSDEAIELFKSQGETYKVELIEDP